jgi:hypothetical protein
MARKKLTKSPSDTILIVTSNQAAMLYFSQMRKDCRYANLSVTCLDHAKDLTDFITKAARLKNRGGYTVGWALFDFADFAVGAEEVKAVLPLAEQKKLRLGWNNPSQSLWYLLHYQAPRGVVTDAKVFDQALGNLIPGYKAGAEYLLTDGLAFHLSLYPVQSRAVNNADAYNKMAVAQTGLDATNIPQLLHDIIMICGKADITHNQRQLGNKK